MLSDLPVHPTIPAKDFVRAKKFYSDVLGLKMTTDLPGGAMFDCGGGSRLLVYPTPSAGSAPHTLAGFTSPDLEREMADLRGRGVVFEEYDFPGLKTVNGIADAGPTRAAWFKDSEGNIIGIVEFK